MPPFVELADDLRQLMQKTYENQVSEKLVTVTHPLGPIIHQCLRTAPAERYSDFSTLRKAVEVIAGRELPQVHQTTGAE